MSKEYSLFCSALAGVNIGTGRHFRYIEVEEVGCVIQPVDWINKSYPPMRTDPTRAEMIALVKRISAAEGTEAEIDDAVELFVANCKHPDGTDLIFWPHGFPHDPSKPEPTVEEIVDKAMSGRGG